MAGPAIGTGDRLLPGVDRRSSQAFISEGTGVWGEDPFSVGIGVASFSKVGPSFLLCLPTQLLTPILCATMPRSIDRHRLLIEAPSPQLMAEIRTRKTPSTKTICEGLAKLCSAPVLKGKLHPLLQQHAVDSSPVFVVKAYGWTGRQSSSGFCDSARPNKIAWRTNQTKCTRKWSPRTNWNEVFGLVQNFPPWCWVNGFGSFWQVF
jgi:hypothetical protein